MNPYANCKNPYMAWALEIWLIKHWFKLSLEDRDFFASVWRCREVRNRK